MASKKRYSYYLRGNQIAIIEEDTGLGSGTCSLSNYKNKVACENAGGTWTAASSSGGDLGLYKSPQESITDGLEIEYAYSPRYTIDSETNTQINKFYLNGWTVIDGYLTFVRSHDDDIPNWDSSPYNTVGDDEYIVIRESARWNGLHKVKTATSTGYIQTYTRVNKSTPVVYGSSNIDIAAEADDKAFINANAGTNLWLNALFSTGDYIFIHGSATAKNNGFWKIHSVADSTSSEATSGIYIADRHYCYDKMTDGTLTTEGIDTTPDTTAQTDESVTIYKAYRDFCYLTTDVDALSDESDTIDLPEYLTKALVYYVKAQLAEDQ
jgi:hypothetical protein